MHLVSKTSMDKVRFFEWVHKRVSHSLEKAHDCKSCNPQDWRFESFYSHNGKLNSKSYTSLLRSVYLKSMEIRASIFRNGRANRLVTKTVLKTAECKNLGGSTPSPSAR